MEYNNIYYLFISEKIYNCLDKYNLNFPLNIMLMDDKVNGTLLLFINGNKIYSTLAYKNEMRDAVNILKEIEDGKIR